MIILVVAPIFGGFFFSRSRIWFFIETIAIILILGGFNGTLDLESYQYRYEMESNPFKLEQQLYSLTSMAFHKMGFSFEAYHFIITAMVILIIGLCVLKLSNQPAYVMSLIGTFSVLETAWQLKTLMCMGVLIIALWWHYRKIFEPERVMMWSYAVYVLLVLIASQFHYFALFFLLFLFNKGHRHKNTLLKLIIFLDIGVFVLSDPLLRFGARFYLSLNRYLTPMSIISTVVTILWQVIGIAIVYYVQKNRTDKFSEWIYDGSIIFLLLIPMYKYTVVATRIFRIWMIFVSVYASTLKRRRSFVSAGRLVYDAYNIMSCFYWFIFVGFYQGGSSMLKYLLGNNIIASL